MSLIQKSISHMRRHGLRRTFEFGVCVMDDLLFDLRHGTNTAPRIDLKRLAISSENKERGLRYEGTPTIPFNYLMKQVSFPKGSVFVDFGSGKGKGLMVAANFNFKRMVGIEFSPELCALASKNIDKYKKTKKPTAGKFEIILDDVVNYKIKADENVFYFYNPFDETIFHIVMNNIIESLIENPRAVWIVYNYPALPHVVENTKKFSKIFSHSYGFTNISVYFHRVEVPC